MWQTILVISHNSGLADRASEIFSSVFSIDLMNIMRIIFIAVGAFVAWKIANKIIKIAAVVIIAALLLSYFLGR